MGDRLLEHQAGLIGVLANLAYLQKYTKMFLFSCLVTLAIWCCSAAEETLDHASSNSMHEKHYPNGEHDMHYDHKAVLGSSHLEQEFDGLSPTEAKERLSKLFDKMDTNKDKFITKLELTSWIHNSFRKLDEEEALDKMASHDLNADGNVTWAEFVKQVYDYYPSQVEDFDKDANPQIRSIAKMIELDKMKFAAADVNEDHVLDKSEYPAFLHPYDFEHMHTVELLRILADFDRNKDGAVDFAEYMYEEGEAPFERNKEQDIVDEENFKTYDLDGNGKLEADEIRKWALPDHEEAAAEEAEHLIDETDENKDGRLSRPEVLVKYELWVGSSATDYGRSLHDPSEL